MAKKLTKSQKLSRLKKIKNTIIANDSNYCVIGFMCNIYKNTYGVYTNLFADIPKLLKYKPKKMDSDDAWFDVDKIGILKRIKILNKTINDIEKYGKKSTK
jgi:hypothetical protein